MVDLIVILILIAAVGGASVYLIRAKKKGKKCIGCPSGECPKCKENSRKQEEV